MLATLQKIDDAAVVPVIPHREENIMAVAVALDHDLVRAVPQKRAPSPAITFSAAKGGSIPPSGATVLDVGRLRHPEVPHHPHVFVLKDMAVVEVEAGMTCEFHLYADGLSGQHQHCIPPTGINDACT